MDFCKTVRVNNGAKKLVGKIITQIVTYQEERNSILFDDVESIQDNE